MSQYSYDAAMVCRVYPKPSSSKPSVYAEDKFKLVEFCFKSFIKSAVGVRVKLWVLLNNCPAEYEAFFRKNWPENDLVVLHYPGVPPGTTLREQSRILMEQTDAEIVYFAEDDYFYLPGQFKIAVDFLKANPDANLLSPYEHPDLHQNDLHRLRKETFSFGGKTWLSCVSNTHTFMTTRTVLVRNRRLFLTFNGTTNPDLAMWMALTKKRVFNPFKFLLWLPAHKFWSGSIFYAWYFFWRQVLFGRRHKLWVSSPSIATHMVATLEAPGVDWPREFQKQMGDGPA